MVIQKLGFLSYDTDDGAKRRLFLRADLKPTASTRVIGASRPSVQRTEVSFFVNGEENLSD